jgi:hypothetical protein
MLCSLALPTLDLTWATEVDWATCFGVYFCAEFDCLVSHGELAIAGVSLRGEVLWSESGRDIFSEGFRIVDDEAEAIDFYGAVYRFDIASGKSRIVHDPSNERT